MYGYSHRAAARFGLDLPNSRAGHEGGQFMRSMILFIALLTAALLVLPRGGFAFDVDTATPSNPDGSSRFSDPDEAPSSAGTLQVFGGAGETTTSDSAYIPQPPQPDLPGWFYSTPAFRSMR
jgi:hypothetical protein